MRVLAGGMSAYARRFGGRTALTTGAGSQTFAELVTAGHRFGDGLRSMGIRPGDRVAVLSHNRAEVVQCWLGLEAHGFVRVVLHSHFDMGLHADLIDRTEARVVVFDTRFGAQLSAYKALLGSVRVFVAIGDDPPDWAVPFASVQAAGSPDDPGIDLDEDDPVCVQPTTGTTGTPKPWTFTHRSWRGWVQQNLYHLDTFAPDLPSVGPQDVNLHVHALQWASGAQTLYPYLLRGARTVLLDDEVFDPGVVVDTIIGEGVTGVLLPAPMLTPVLDLVEARGGIPHQLRRLVIFFATPELLRRTTELLGPVWCHGFGSTEQGAVTTRLLAHEAMNGHPGLLSSVGRPASPFLEVAIMDERGEPVAPGEVGEIVVRSAMSDSGYWGSPDRTADAFFADGWFRPLDLGYLDDDGFLYYVDRAKDRIVTAAGVVYPHLVEEAVLRHPAVAGCGVVGLDTAHGREVVAAVRLKAGSVNTTELVEEIATAARPGLRPHERPHRIVVMTDLPTVLGGAKVRRDLLRERLESVST
ncbi:class I adenylate-forming enzyme family protein [Plantactinospora sp. GCM10030261]|uniref:class I adenylate-forming enzyme family protein n=1 Tax=Plantactinospora sp. GCM10030261 TaxID=3273420 RepID=UPI00361A5F97